VAQLPAPLKTLIGPMADVGAPFRYEHGGITYFWQAVVARVRPDGTVIPVANAGTVDDKLCAITDGAFTGTVPPYPDDSWQASGF
jgi:hypothetical protein